MEGAAKQIAFLRTEGIGKEFGGVWVLRGVDFDLKKGEVHALVGENGAGKSTLVKILSGVHQPSEGRIFLGNREIHIRDARHSEMLGIRTVHQEIHQVPFFTIAENVFLGSEPNRRICGIHVIDRKSMRSRAREVLDELGIDVDERQVGYMLGASVQRIVEICKALVHRPEVMIFDEPTTSLADRERERLLKIIADLRKRVGIIYVSHNLDEVFRLADRITVFRDGQKIATVNTNETSENEIIGMMIGQKQYVHFQREHVPASSNEVLLEVKNVNSHKLRDVNLSVRKGEIVGVIGVVGAGKTELARAIFGIDRVHSGEFWLDGEKIHPSPSVSVRKGIALVPEERQKQGLILRMSVSSNMTLAYLSRWARRGVLSPLAERGVGLRYIKALGIKTTGPDQVVRYLSGGNQQKVVLSRWLSGEFKVGLFDDPTRGIDVKAKQDIYQLMGQLAVSGKAIVFFSSYLPEIISVSDRIVVMRGGRIVGEFDPRSEGVEAQILSAMLGGRGGNGEPSYAGV